MLNYQEVDALFGAPLNTVPKPQVPFKLKTWHIVGGIVVIGLVSYGLYSLYQDYIADNDPEKEG
jgi:hypothetical protein